MTDAAPTTTRRARAAKVPWLWVSTAVVASVGLTRLAVVPSVGERFWVVLACAAVMGLCVRVLERVFWWRFPASVEATASGWWTAKACAGLLVIHAVLVAAGV